MTVYTVKKGSKFSVDVERLETELTPEMIAKYVNMDQAVK